MEDPTTSFTISSPRVFLRASLSVLLPPRSNCYFMLCMPTLEQDHLVQENMVGQLFDRGGRCLKGHTNMLVPRLHLTVVCCSHVLVPGLVLHTAVASLHISPLGILCRISVLQWRFFCISQCLLATTSYLTL
jgi:hypothetical protein